MLDKLSCKGHQLRLFRSLLTVSSSHHLTRHVQSSSSSSSSSSSLHKAESTGFDVEEEFEQVDVLPEPRDYFIQRKRTREYGRDTVPRASKMATDQHWPSVWPSSRMFHPGTVPLPVHQGYVSTSSGIQPMPDRWNNVELMKIPNFLHLTPNAIRQQTKALTKFCTQWPSGLETDEQCEHHFPMEVISTDRVFTSPSIRDLEARRMEIKFRLSRLSLDEHSRQKMIKLLRHRYDEKTDMVTITTDSCPYKKQNYDYALYLMTASFFESWKTESWEQQETDQANQSIN